MPLALHRLRLLYFVLEIEKGPIHPPSWSIDPYNGAYLDETLRLGVAVRRELLIANVMTFSFYKCHRVHIYSPETSCRARQPLNSFLNED